MKEEGTNEEEEETQQGREVGPRGGQNGGKEQGGGKKSARTYPEHVRPCAHTQRGTRRYALYTVDRARV